MVPFRIVTYPSTQFLHDTVEHQRSLIALDERVFGVLGVEDAGEDSHWRDITRHRPDTDAVALDLHDQPIGYLDIFPLTADAANLVKTGGMGDGELWVAHIPPMGSRAFSLYVMAVAVSPEWQGRGVAKQLWNHAIAYWQILQPTEVLATIWSESGQKFFAPNRRVVILNDDRGHQTVSLHLRPYAQP